MLKATQLLLSLNEIKESAPYIEVINRHGTLIDSEKLCQLFLETKDPALLRPIMLHGSTAIANDLFTKAIVNGKLHPDFPPETFFTLSYLGHAETEHLLFGIYKQIFDGKVDWDLHRIVCLSLLNYSCSTYKNLIENEIEKCLTVHLFPEFIPVLACKTGDAALAERMYEHGNTKASSDASAGLILGIALFGEKYKSIFKSIIWNPVWEAGSTATGNGHYTLMGMRSLNISLLELYQELQNIIAANEDKTLANFHEFVGLLRINLIAPEQYHLKSIKKQQESFTTLYHELFKWKNPNFDDSIIGLLSKYANQNKKNLDYLLDELYTLKENYNLKAEHEIELSCYTPWYI
jgi:hypothetical protein